MYVYILNIDRAEFSANKMEKKQYRAITCQITGKDRHGHKNDFFHIYPNKYCRYY